MYRVRGSWLLALLVGAAALGGARCLGKISAKDWSKIDFDQLDKDWEEGDDEQDLKTESQLLFEKMERKREEMQRKPFDPSSLASMDPADVGKLAAGQQNMAGPAMMFTQLWGEGGREACGGNSARGDERGAKEWGTECQDTPLSKEDTAGVGDRLKNMAFAGGLDMSTFAIDPGQLLVSTQKGWEGREILDFLLSRAEVKKVAWNSQDFFPPQPVAEEL